jgi:hypothetical protein
MSTPPESDAPRVPRPLPDRRRRAGAPALAMIAALAIVAVLIVLL